MYYAGTETLNSGEPIIGLLVVLLLVIGLAGGVDLFPNRPSPYGDFVSNIEKAHRQREKQRLQKLLAKMEAEND